MTDAARLRISLIMAGYALVAGLAGGGAYLYLGLAGQMITDWVGLNVAFGPIFAVVSLAALRRQPRNRAVWALMCAAVMMSTQALSLGVLQARIARLDVSPVLEGLIPAELPLTAAVGLQTASWIWIAVLYVICFAVLFFPDGQLPGPRWRWVARGIAGAMVVAVTVAAWIGRPTSSIAPMSETMIEHLPVALATLYLAGLLGLALSLVAVTGGVVARYRSSTGQVRLQIRWVAWAGALFVVQFVALFPLQFTSIGLDPYRYTTLISVNVFIGAYVVAITRYRLYEIDRIISRTVSYGLMTAVLVAVYVGAVLGAQALFSSPGAERSPTIVAGSTLLVAALFQPLRRRVQAVVDRRFNRRVHDAARTIADFSGRLRGDVELESLVDDLRATVAGVVQPTAVSVWVSPPATDA
jgi:hypothetical protein